MKPGQIVFAALGSDGTISAGTRGNQVAFFLNGPQFVRVPLPNRGHRSCAA